MKKYFYLIIVFFFGLIACDGNSGKNQNEQDSLNTENQEKISNSNTEENINTVPLTLTTFNEDAAKKLNYKGELVYGRSWTDTNGENMIIFSEKTNYIEEKDGPGYSDVELHAYHYAKSTGDYKLIREVKDFERKCMFDNRARFVEESVDISDINKDGYAEITFVYRLGCSSELSPDGLKLMMLENGDKYAIRGETEVEFNGMLGGETNVDASFNTAPDGFLAHAKKIWKAQQVHNVVWNKPRPYLLKKLEKYTKAKFGGVEPNWSVEIKKDQFLLTPNIGETPIKFNITEVRKMQNGLYISGEKPGEGPYRAAGIDIKEEKCSDGMSEKEYPLYIYFNYYNNKKNVQLYGCGRW